MDLSLYKSLTTSRGFAYSYYFSPPRAANEHVVLFCHGFPSTSYDWHSQVNFFKKHGYGIIAPDLLGYGGTDKPTTTESYRMSFMVQDIIEILDHEKFQSIIGIGHDWGTALLTRLAYYHPAYFKAFGFLAAFVPIDPEFELRKANDATQKVFGYDLFGYWEFYSSDDAPKIIEGHFQSFYSLLFPHDPVIWKKHVAPLGRAREWLLSNRIEKRVSYLSEAEWRQHQRILRQGGLAAPLCWYKAMVNDYTPAEERNLKLDTNKLKIDVPVFFGAALHDYICRPEMMKQVVQKFCPNARIVDFETDHWINLATPDEVNKEIMDWIRNDVEGYSKMRP